MIQHWKEIGLRGFSGINSVSALMSQFSDGNQEDDT